MVRIRYDGERFAPNAASLPAGPAVLAVENSGAERGEASSRTEVGGYCSHCQVLRAKEMAAATNQSRRSPG